MNLDYVNNWSEKMNGSHKTMSKDEYSVTELLKDATAIMLKRRHYNAIPTDIQALADINAGTAVHESLEESAREAGWVTEVELKVSIIADSGKFYLYGKCDLYRDGVLADIKNTKEASYNKALAGQDDEWKKQLTAYAMMLETLDSEGSLYGNWYKGIDTMQIHARITDLSVVGNAKKGESTDKWRVLNFDPPSADDYEDILSQFIYKVNLIRALEQTPDEDLPICSEKFRFAESKWKIYGKTKSGEWKKTAENGHANYSSEAEAKEGFDKAGFTEKDHKIEKVGGESLKCRYFCDVAQWCPHYKNMMEADNDKNA